MKYKSVLFVFLIIPAALFSQVDKTDDFYFTSIEEKVRSFVAQAQSIGAGDPVEKLSLALDAYELSTAEGFLLYKADSLALMGEAYFELLEIEKSLESLTESYNLSERINYREGRWLSALSLGRLHHYLDELPEAVNYLEEAMAIFPEPDSVRFISVSRELAVIMKETAQYDRSIELISEALLAAADLGEKKAVLDLTLHSGEAHFLAGLINDSVTLFTDVLSRTADSGEYHTIRAGALSLLGQCYALLGEYHLALSNGQQALLLSVNYDYLEGRLMAYDSLSFTYQKMNDFENAFKYLQNFYTFKEIHDKQRNTDRLEKIKAFYQLSEKDREIGEQQEQIRSLNRLLIAGSLMIGLIIIFLLIFYMLYKKNQRIAEQLSKDLRKEMILSKTDRITGLPNKRGFDEILQEACKNWKTNHKVFTLVMVSFEEHKKIDKDFKEGAGEVLQKYAGQILTKELTGQDVVSLWKPFVFLILLPETDEIEAEAVRKKIRTRFSLEHFIFEGTDIELTLRTGRCSYSGQGSRTDCISRCKEDLYNN